MSKRVYEYFANEATEYLDQLDRLLAQPGEPDPGMILRLATGVRGSARMADAETVARVAERLEDAARSIVGQSIAWSEEIRNLIQQTVGDLQLLVRALHRWGEEEERRVRSAIERWDEVEAGGSTEDTGVDADDDADATLPIVPIADLMYDGEQPRHPTVMPANAGASGAGGEGADDGPSDTAEGRQSADVPPGGVDDDRVVPIGELLLRGDDALREALQLRPLLEEIARGDAMPERPLVDVVAELFDLLELASERDQAAG